MQLPAKSAVKQCLFTIFALAICLVSTTTLGAQATDTATHAPDPDTGMGGHFSSIYVPLIPAQPFHAKVLVNITRQLPDGSTVAQKYYVLVARDGVGHVYHESRELVAADSDREPALMRTFVYDPKASLTTTCIPTRQTCQQTRLITTAPAEVAVGPSSDGKSVIARESIGKKKIDGLEVEGTRETQTFNPGSFGNDKPVVVTREFWYSPQLQINLAVDRNDPRNGTQKVEVTELKLGEPGAEWFAIPDGYRLVVQRALTQTGRQMPTLAKMIETRVSGYTPDQLSEELKPVEAAITAYAKAHAAAAPNDPLNKPLNTPGIAEENTPAAAPDDSTGSRFIQNTRSRLSSEIMMMQQVHTGNREQLENIDLRLNESYRNVLASPCMGKPIPGDPTNFPISGDKLQAEQQAWLQLRDAWTAFLTKMFPNNDPHTFGLMLTNERASEMQRYENAERNRGCEAPETIEPLLVRYISGKTEDQLAASLKPVDAAVDAYTKAHTAASPNDNQENFGKQTRQRLAMQLRNMQQNQIPTREQYEEADLHLNQAFRAVTESPCLNKPVPGDPPDLPVSEPTLRAEQTAWLQMRDAWTAFLDTLYPTDNHAGYGFMLTNERVYQLQRLQSVEHNRGCKD